MTFEAVAKDVIKNSIRSAVCIDDEYPSAYQEGDFPKRPEATKLYNSFRDTGECDLDIYNFETLEISWKKKYMIPNKDLIILDWELKKGEVEKKYIDTLEILSEIIESNHVPFVVIYTHTEDISQVSRVLIEEFSDYTPNQKDLIEVLESKLSECEPSEELEIEELLEDEPLLKLFYNYIHNYKKRAEIEELILNYWYRRLSRN